MLHLPADGEGLSWIVSHDPTRLQLIPGLQPISIAAAAAGDQQALAYLRFAAQHHAVHPGGSAHNELDRVLVRIAAAVQAGDRYAVRTALRTDGAQFADLIEAREDHTVSLITQAIREGELAAVMWMHAICIHRLSMFGLTVEAAEAGQLAILKYLSVRSQFKSWDEDTVEAALPHLDCLKWLLTADAPGGPCPHSPGILCGIAQHHGLPAVQWFCEHCDIEVEFCDEAILETAVELADRPMVEWLRAHNPPAPWHASICVAAAQRGDISMLGWLRRLNPPCPWDESVTAAAASRDVRTLAWLRAQEPPCPWDPSACAAAAKSGKLDVLMWLRDRQPPCPWDATCAEAACSQPDVNIPQWLLQQQGHWEPRTQSICINNAARTGHLAMLEWLSSIGIPLTAGLYAAAARAGHMHILRFLRSRRVALETPPVQVNSRFSYLPLQMVMSDLGMLHESHMPNVRRARRACCIFHGLVRWCRQAVSDPSREAHLAFDSLAKDRSGQMLLLRISKLPPELVTKIAVAADLQYEI